MWIVDCEPDGMKAECFVYDDTKVNTPVYPIEPGTYYTRAEAELVCDQLNIRDYGAILDVWRVEYDDKGAWCWRVHAGMPPENYVPVGRNARLTMAGAELLCDQLNIRDFGRVFDHRPRREVKHH